MIVFGRETSIEKDRQIYISNPVWLIIPKAFAARPLAVRDAMLYALPSDSREFCSVFSLSLLMEEREQNSRESE
jgi:hypothetical protein